MRDDFAGGATGGHGFLVYRFLYKSLDLLSSNCSHFIRFWFKYLRSALQVCRLLPDFISDFSQETFSPGDVFLVFNPLWRGPIHDAQDAAPLPGLNDQHLGRVGGGAKDVADFRRVLDGFQHIDRVEPVPKKHNE